MPQTTEENMETKEAKQENCWTCQGAEYYEVGEYDEGGQEIFIECPDCNGTGLRLYPEDEEVGTPSPMGITLKGLYVLTGRYEEWKEMKDGQ